jgi:Zinc carboxypeptidase
MRLVAVLSALFFLFTMTNETAAQTAQELAAIWDKQHITTMPASRVHHSDLKKYIEKLKQAGLTVAEVGRSGEDREIYQAEWGKGKLKIFMWSQMHGDEPTATSALMDMLYFLQKNRRLKWVAELENAVTIRAVPMLNPDGQERFQRRNAQSIDINRDARDLSTPEGRLLKKLRDEWQPEIGFNLHNQNGLTTVGKSGEQSTISLLAVSGNAESKFSPEGERNKRLCAVMISALGNFIKGHVARYEDDYNPRAFGDRMSEWGTATILIETGELHGKDEMFLIKINFVAYLAALNALVSGNEKQADAGLYDKLTFNDSGWLYSYIFRDANVVELPADPAIKPAPFKADVAVNSYRRRAGDEPALSVQEIGDLDNYYGLEEIDAGNYFLVPIDGGVLKPGSPAGFLFYKKDRAQNIDWTAKDLQKKYPPDGIFDKGKWIRPLNK